MTDHHSDPSRNSDDSIEAAMRALKKSERTTEEKVGDESGAEQGQTTPEPSIDPVDRAVKWMQERVAKSPVGKLAALADVFWNNWARPVTRFVNPLLHWVGNIYRWCFAKFAYRRDESGARIFAKNRAAVLTITLLVLTILIPITFVTQIVPLTFRTIYDAAMLTTLQQDRLYLGRADLVSPNDSVFQVMGCRDISGCEGGDNTTYFRLRPNVIMSIRYWTTRFEPFDPAEIAGAMVSELNDCSITYYGRRVKAMGWYPYIIGASCTPV